MDPKYPNHPHKGEIDKRIDNGDSAKSIVRWLETFNDPTIRLSLPTITKIRKRRQLSMPQLGAKQAIKAVKAVEIDKKIKSLWATVRLCDDLEGKMDKRVTITSIKDWQYINQQKQDALKLIAELQGEKGSGNDISVVLSKIFAKIEHSEEKKPEEETIDSVIQSLRDPKKDESRPI
jgi:hypothetical protein